MAPAVNWGLVRYVCAAPVHMGCTSQEDRCGLATLFLLRIRCQQSIYSAGWRRARNETQHPLFSDSVCNSHAAFPPSLGADRPCDTDLDASRLARKRHMRYSSRGWSGFSQRALEDEVSFAFFAFSRCDGVGVPGLNRHVADTMKLMKRLQDKGSRGRFGWPEILV